MRRKCRHVEPVFLEAHVPQAFGGHRGKQRHIPVAIDLQHMIVAVVHHVQNARRVEDEPVRTFEQIPLRKCRRGAIAADPGNGIVVAVRDVQVARRLVDGDADRPSQPTSGKERGVTGPIDLGDEVAVEARLEQVALMVDGVTGGAVEALGKDLRLALGGNFPNDIAEIRDI